MDIVKGYFIENLLVSPQKFAVRLMAKYKKLDRFLCRPFRCAQNETREIGEFCTKRRLKSDEVILILRNCFANVAKTINAAIASIWTASFIKERNILSLFP